MDNQKTPDAIVAEMRRKRYPSYDYVAGDIEAILRHWADRLEAALKLDRSNAIKAAMMAKCEVCHDVQGNKVALRQALELCMRYMCEYCRKEAAFSMPGKQCVDGCETLRVVKAALAAPARNCDLIANELSIDPERVPAELNKCENAPIRELIRWIFAKAEPKGGVA